MNNSKLTKTLNIISTFKPMILEMIKAAESKKTASTREKITLSCTKEIELLNSVINMSEETVVNERMEISMDEIIYEAGVVGFGGMSGIESNPYKFKELAKAMLPKKTRRG